MAACNPSFPPPSEVVVTARRENNTGPLIWLPPLAAFFSESPPVVNSQMGICIAGRGEQVKPTQGCVSVSVPVSEKAPSAMKRLHYRTAAGASQPGQLPVGKAS